VEASAAHRGLPVLEPPPEQRPSFDDRNRAVARVQLLWDQRRVLLRFVLWGVLGFAALALLIPPKYESVTQLMPPDTDHSGLSFLAGMAGKNSDDNLTAYAGDLLAMKSSGAMFIGVLHSRRVQDALINKFDLRGVYWVSRWEDARKELESRTSIAEERKSGIISIRVRDRHPERAQALARAYVDQLNIAVATLSTSAARREREFLETRLVAVKLDLDQAAKDFSQFASQNTAIDIPAQGKAMVEAAARLQGELIAAQAEAHGLEQIYTANNARVRAAQGRISELQKQLDKLGGATDSPGQTGEDSLYPSIRKLPLLGVTYADLYRRTKIQEAVYETLTKQYELAKVQEAKEIPMVKVLDPPSYPERKASPPRLAILVLGTLLALALGCGWVLGKSAWEAVDSSDPAKTLATEVLVAAKRTTLSIKERIRRSG